MFDQGAKPGMAWRRHHDRLHLRTAKAFSALPCFPFPVQYPRCPSREQVVECLESYAQHFDLQPQCGQQVTSARRDGDGRAIKTPSRLYRARHLVIATGYNREPVVPTRPSQRLFRGSLIRSAQYHNSHPHPWMGIQSRAT